MSKAIIITNPSGVTLKTKNKYMDDDVAISLSEAENILANNIKKDVSILGVSGTYEGFVPSGSVTISENGTYNISAFAEAVVSVPGLVPSGTLEISSNGVYDVGAYASASVNVQSGGEGQTIEELVTKTISYYEGATLWVIPDYCFQSCSNLSYVSVISLPATPSKAAYYIGSYAFNSCSNLSAFNILSDDNPFDSRISYISVSAYAFTSCTNFTPNVSKVIYVGPVGFSNTNISEINVSMSYYKVSYLANAFAWCSNLSSIKIYASTISISGGCFTHTNITNIYSDSFSQVSGYPYFWGAQMFESCSNLKTVDMFISDSTVGEAWFNSCINLESCNLRFSRPVQYINMRAFYNCRKLSSLTFSTGVSSTCTISPSAFAWCYSLSSFIYMSSIQTLQSSAFYGAGIKKWEASQTQYIYNWCFEQCSSLRYFKNPSVAINGSNIFRLCENLSYAYTGNAALRVSTFASCYKLESFLASANVFTSSSIFNYCSSFKSLYLASTAIINLAYTNIFYNTPMYQSSYLGYYGSIYVRSSLLDSYKVATNWAAYSDRFVGVTDEEMEQIITDYINVSYIEE